MSIQVQKAATVEEDYEFILKLLPLSNRVVSGIAFSGYINCTEAEGYLSTKCLKKEC